ncbi:type III secretion system effector [unidentified bacterial endosymbiont]|uniref:type III secretion system effector n=1 Tax=unidentified bacterial endosymbiont TaxID=2355 RepID=UPI00209CA8C9|nr:type III secretion system effector [unidentified bacterial endosymbiont]
MTLCIGNSFSSVHISTKRLNDIDNNMHLPKVSAQEKIKEFFSYAHQAEALQCICNLFHHQELNLTPEQINKTFIRLQELAPPGYKELFSVINQDSQSKFILKGVKGEVLLSLDISSDIVSEQTKRYEGNYFRLAQEIDKLYPRTLNVSLDSIDRIVVFGDSLSDSRGRMFEKTYHIFPSSSQYYDGRFTNGFVWSEFLSSPTFLNKKILNLAEGGSTSASYSCFNIIGDFLSNIDKQTKCYSPSKTDLPIFLLGANDYITLHKQNVLKVVEQQIKDIDKILSQGVKNVLVMGVPDLSATPYERLRTDKEKMKDATTAHNALLAEKVIELTKRYPTQKILYFDTCSAFNKITEIADEMGYNTIKPYTEHGYIHLEGKEPELNTHPEYLFNDKVHPTQEVHYSFAAILQRFIINNFSAVNPTKLNQ